MDTVEMICKQDIEYPPGRYRTPGERFQVEENHVNLFLTIGRAEIAQQPARPTIIERVKRKYTKRK